MPTNNDIIEQGLKMARKAIYQAIWKQMKTLSIELLRRAVEDYNGRNLTGNTITSISAGLYDVDSPYPIILNAIDVIGLREPIWHKLTEGDIWIGEDYDGNYRYEFAANVKTDVGYGANTSYKFLLDYKLPAECSLGIVLCTGTEYSEYLKDELNYDVLVGAYKSAPMMAEGQWRKIKV